MTSGCLLACRLGLVAVYVVAALLVLLRLFGMLFFVSTVSIWALVPAIAISGLLALSIRSARLSVLGSLLMICLYVVYWIMYGGASALERIDDQGSILVDSLEIAVVLFLGIRSVLLGSRS